MKKESTASWFLLFTLVWFIGIVGPGVLIIKSFNHGWPTASQWVSGLLHLNTEFGLGGLREVWLGLRHLVAGVCGVGIWALCMLLIFFPVIGSVKYMIDKRRGW